MSLFERARYYDPYTGRFISEDSYWGEDENPLSLNLYTYCHNDPLRFVDPTGHSAEDAVKAWLETLKQLWGKQETEKGKDTTEFTGLQKVIVSDLKGLYFNLIIASLMEDADWSGNSGTIPELNVKRRSKMKTAVVYYSRTGHSKKIAEGLAAALRISAADIKTKPILDAVDLLFVVGGIYGGASSPELKAYITGINERCIKKAALITSCLSNKQKQDMIREILNSKKIEVIPEEFICRGSLLLLGFGHPDKADIQAAISFAERVISEYT